MTLEKPANITYQPGQAVDISISKPDWEDKLAAFTFTSLEKDPQLEFTIKTYPSIMESQTNCSTFQQVAKLSFKTHLARLPTKEKDCLSQEVQALPHL